MWKSGIEVELRRLIWQIAVMGKYISAKIHESNRKLAGFKNVYGEDQLALDRISDEILKNMMRNSGFVREYASEELDDIITIGHGQEKYIVTADPVDGSSLVDTNLAIGTIIGIHKNTIFDCGKNSMVAPSSLWPLITDLPAGRECMSSCWIAREYVLLREYPLLRGDPSSPGGLRRDWTGTGDISISWRWMATSYATG